MPTFRDNWVKSADDHEANWREWTTGLDVRSILEIGSFEGRSALLWRKICPDAVVVCVDIFGGLHEDAYPGYESRFDDNTAHDLDILKWKGTSKDMFWPELRVSPWFDVIYIDGDHSELAVLSDARNCWPHLRVGGLVIFDDYEWDFLERPGGGKPKEGIDRFLAETTGWELVAKGWQVCIRRAA